MLLLAADENFNNDIVRGLLRRRPDLDIITGRARGRVPTSWRHKSHFVTWQSQ
jgi:hypothetical protein